MNDFDDRLRDALRSAGGGAPGEATAPEALAATAKRRRARRISALAGGTAGLVVLISVTGLTLASRDDSSDVVAAPPTSIPQTGDLAIPKEPTPTSSQQTTDVAAPPVTEETIPESPDVEALTAPPVPGDLSDDELPPTDSDEREWTGSESVDVEAEILTPVVGPDQTLKVRITAHNTSGLWARGSIQRVTISLDGPTATPITAKLNDRGDDVPTIGIPLQLAPNDTWTRDYDVRLIDVARFAARTVPDVLPAGDYATTVDLVMSGGRTFHFTDAFTMTESLDLTGGALLGCGSLFDVWTICLDGFASN